MSGTILAIDLGGTHLRAASAPLAEPLKLTELGAWPAPRTRDELVALLTTQIARVGADRLGIGVPGLTGGTVCNWIPNLPFLDGLDLAAAFPGKSVALGNDAQLALLAEASAGAAKGVSDAILLAIGTGIGSAVLAGGQIIAGSQGGACSFGWAAADPDDAGDDVSGWLERHASGRALDAAARELGLADGIALVAAARAGNESARRALTPPMQALGTALAGAVALLNPSVVILAGGVAQSLDVLEPLMAAPLRRQLPRHLRDIAIRAGQFGARAGLVGAAFAGARGEHWRRQHG